ncbi:MAG: HD-GYP domain-containing protein [bacterium]
MRRIPVSSLEPGQKVMESIEVPSPQDNVQFLLRIPEGTKLTQKHIRRLRDANVNYITVRDPATDDLDEYVFDPELEQAQEEVIEQFNRIAEENENGGLSREEIGRFRSTIDNLVDRLKNSQVMASFTTLKTQDNYTARHSLDVAKISLMLVLKDERYFRSQLKQETSASQKYVNRYLLEDLGMGAMLHDLGKQNVPNDILKKPGKLSDSEFETIKSHPEHGYEELKQFDIELNAPVKVPAFQHHEKFNGSGYPRGRSGKNIHLYGRITALADVFSALTSSRPYRDAKSSDRALTIMHDMQSNGPHFDPELYDRFLEVVYPYPVGLDVKLSDGSRGVVSEVNPNCPDQPTVRVLYKNGSRLSNPREIQVNTESTPDIKTESKSVL